MLSAVDRLELSDLAHRYGVDARRFEMSSNYSRQQQN